ncbi:MAG: acyl-CoA thioesterase [Candidatus Latescibacterota bacterium]|nr:acyl-CoA thioesterase [Candidatus Latescibacterota bacterium]
MSLRGSTDWAFIAGPFDVRDYECDLQGVVNNAVYLNYLEHARHSYLSSVGIDFSKLTASGYHLVVTRSELDYLKPLTSNDRYVVCLDMSRVKRIRWCGDQAIYRVNGDEEELVLEAKILGTGVIDGKVGLPTDLLEVLEVN